MVDITRCFALTSFSIMDTINVIDTSGMQTALIVDDDRRLVGIFTDGDLRRTVLKGVDLSRNITDVMNITPVTVPVGISDDDIRELMQEREIHHIPVVDEFNRVLSVASYLELLKRKKLDNIVVLMLGGLGTRLRPLTDSCPKPLLRIGGKPILEIILDNFISCGFHEFYFSVNYKSEMIEKYFGDGSAWDVNISYIKEEKRMGTAGSLGLLPVKPTKPIVVMNGDILTKIDFKELLHYHVINNADATMAVRQHEFTIPYGVVDIDGAKMINVVEKPIKKYMVNAGIYVLNPLVLDEISGEEHLDMPVLYEDMLRKNRNIAAYPVNEYWLDIGKMDDFRQAQIDYASMWS